MNIKIILLNSQQKRKEERRKASGNERDSCQNVFFKFGTINISAIRGRTERIETEFNPVLRDDDILVKMMMIINMLGIHTSQYQ